VVVLAVKPQVIQTVATQLEAGALEGKLLMSIAAGVTISALEHLFGKIAIARTMPNTPALLGLGATGLYVNSYATEAQARVARDIIEAFGICVPVKQEKLLDAVTAVSGSGPAYYFLMIEEMIKAGVQLGLSEDEAKALTLQTALGAAHMVAKGDATPEELRQRVTSPNGTTHAAIISMQENGFGPVIANAMKACQDRAEKLGR
jgi:pyrroline-5-carboxylate reductase